jgi:hypothetical protein
MVKLLAGSQVTGVRFPSGPQARSAQWDRGDQGAKRAIPLGSTFTS